MKDWAVMPDRPRRAIAGGDQELGRSQTSDRAAVPVWVERLQAVGLPTTETDSRAAMWTGSQRFINRWNRVSCGH